MRSVWPLIEQRINEIPLSIEMSVSESYAVTMAIQAAMDRIGLFEAIERAHMENVSDDELWVIKKVVGSFAPQVTDSHTNPGKKIVSLTPKMWKKVYDEVISNKDYFAMFVSNVDDFAGRIKHELDISMGSAPASAGVPAKKKHAQEPTVQQKTTGVTSTGQKVSGTGGIQLGLEDEPDEDLPEVEPEPIDEPQQPQALQRDPGETTRQFNLRQFKKDRAKELAGPKSKQAQDAEDAEKKAKAGVLQKGGKMTVK